MRDPLLPAETTPTAAVVKRAEQSAVREALTSLMEGVVTPQGTALPSKLEQRLEEVYDREGPKKYVDTVIRLLEFVQPKLQRTESQTAPTGPTMPSITINFGSHSAPKTIEVMPTQDDGLG